MFAKNITHSATCAYPAERDYTALQTEERERRKERKREREKEREKKERKKRKFTSQLVLCGSVLQGSGLQAGAGVVQRGGVGERRPLQAQSRTATAEQTNTETPPSCDRYTDLM